MTSAGVREVRGPRGGTVVDLNAPGAPAAPARPQTTTLPTPWPDPLDVQAAPVVAAPVTVTSTRARPNLAGPGMALTILAFLLLGFLLTVSVVGAFQHLRDQAVLYGQLRKQLAEATAPVSQADAYGKLLSPGSPVALMEAPQIGLREVVVEGTSSQVTMSGPGHRRDTVLPGQVGVSFVMGRRAAYGAPFRDIGDLSKGSTITVTTGQGASTFQVIGTRRKGDPITPLAPGQGRLTLVTATGAGYLPSGAAYVDADLITAALPTPPRMFTSAALPPSEQTLSGDKSGLVGLVLWAQAFLLAALAAVWAWFRWGHRQAWLVGVPVLAILGILVADHVAALLPNIT